MTLERLPLPNEPPELPGDIDTLIREADTRIDTFFEAHVQHPIRSFIPSDAALVYAVLQHIQSHHLATGRRFLEWGSGFGTATLIAASLGFVAEGIEREAELIEEAEALGRDFGLKADFHSGDYFPPGFDVYRDGVGDTVQLVHGPRGNPLYETGVIDLEYMDVLFIYPWPGEAQMIGELFDAIAPEGALLILYQGPDDVDLLRRVDEEESDYSS